MIPTFIIIFKGQAEKSIPKQESIQMYVNIFSLLYVFGIRQILPTCCSGAGSDMSPFSTGDSLQISGRINFLTDRFYKYMPIFIEIYRWSTFSMTKYHRQKNLTTHKALQYKQGVTISQLCLHLVAHTVIRSSLLGLETGGQGQNVSLFLPYESVPI